MAYCKTIQKVFDPVITAPTYGNPFGTPDSELLWIGTYNYGITVSGAHYRRKHFLDSSRKATPEQREKAFNTFLLHKYRDLF